MMAYKDKALQKQATAKRVRRYRERQRALQENPKGVTLASKSVTSGVTDSDEGELIVDYVVPNCFMCKQYPACGEGG